MKPTSVRSPAGEVLKCATRYFGTRAANFTEFVSEHREEKTLFINLLSNLFLKAGSFTFNMSNGLLRTSVNYSLEKVSNIFVSIERGSKK